MKTLKDAKVGETVRVKKLYGEGPVKRLSLIHISEPTRPY